LLLAALAWALAIFHARHHRWRGSPLELLPWQMLLAALVLLPLALFVEPAPRIGMHLGTLAALAYLGVLAGPLATWAAPSVARALPTVVPSIAFLGVPVLGTALSTFFLGERLSASFLLGGALVLGGVALVAAGGAGKLVAGRRAWDNAALSS